MNCERANESMARYVVRNLIIHKIYLSLPTLFGRKSNWGLKRSLHYLIVPLNVSAQFRVIFSDRNDGRTLTEGLRMNHLCCLNSVIVICIFFILSA